MDINYIKDSLDSVLSQQDFGDEKPDYSTVEGSIAMLERMAEVENSSIAIFDLFRNEFISIKSKYGDQANVDFDAARKYGIAYYISIMHPDDQPVILDTYRKVFQFSFNLPPEEKKSYKTIFTFRLGSGGKYLNFIQQIVTLEVTPAGKIWLGLSISDLLPETQRPEAVQRSVVNISTGKYYLFNEGAEAVQKSLTAREIEVLGLVAKGYISREIADKLFVSVNTVNNHRQRILEKTQASNTSEAILYARTLGLI